MNSISVETLVTLAVAFLGSSIVSVILAWVRDRKHIGAETEATTVSALRESLEALRAEAREARLEAERARADARALREENALLLARIRRLERGE